MTEHKIHDWSLLNREFRDIVQGVMDRWKHLLDSDQSERSCQNFLAEHAGLFFGSNGTGSVISQFQLGTTRKPDFVVVHDNRSGGAHYEFIELKRPGDDLYTKKGWHSDSLDKALQQVQQWQARIAENCTEIQERMPSLHAADRSCSFTIIIGRRGESKEWLSERNQLANQYRVWIHSYDYLTDKLARQQFPHSCSEYWISADKPTLNQLANPFFKAFTDRSWRKLLRQLEPLSEGLPLCDFKFLQRAGKEILSRREYNSQLGEFMKRLAV